MRQVVRLFGTFVAGVLLGLGIRGIPVTAEGGGAAAPSGNGDVNGDGMLNIGDPVYLCRFLFSDGPAPVPIDCGEPPANGPKVRFLNDIACGMEDTGATLDLCGTEIDRITSTDWGKCESLKAASSCAVTVTIETATCGSVCLTAPVTLEDGHIYSFAISADHQGVFALWFDQEGDCSAPTPTDQDVAAGFLEVCPEAGLAPMRWGNFGSLSGWKRPAPR